MEVEDRCMKKTLKPIGILDRIILINRTAVDFSCFKRDVLHGSVAIVCVLTLLTWFALLQLHG